MTDNAAHDTAVAAADLLALRAMRAVANGNCNDLIWYVQDGILTVSVHCSDIFFWGSADSEDITVDNIDLLEATFAECVQTFDHADNAGDLFCARARSERPQGAYYKHLDDDWAALFNAAGPEREVGFGNPMTPEQAKEQAATEAAARQVRIDAEQAAREAANAQAVTEVAPVNQKALDTNGKEFHDEWCPKNGCRCKKCPCANMPDCPKPSNLADATETTDTVQP